MINAYKVNEIFYSIQGEGIRAGTANFFLRFSGCNQTCKIETHGFDCDTEFTSGRSMILEEIEDTILSMSQKCKNIILTGGEPLLQVDEQLIEFFKNKGYYLAIETNGSLLCPDGIDWVTMSPKVAEHAIKQPTCDEIKYVRNVTQSIPKTRVVASHYLLSPAFEQGTRLSQQNLNHCIELIKQNPVWQLSMQYHKLLGVR